MNEFSCDSMTHICCESCFIVDLNLFTIGQCFYNKYVVVDRILRSLWRSGEQKLIENWAQTIASGNEVVAKYLAAAVEAERKVVPIIAFVIWSIN